MSRLESVLLEQVPEEEVAQADTEMSVDQAALWLGDVV